jgi:hypothetical protein
VLLPEIDQVNLARFDCLKPDAPDEKGENHDNGADKQQRTFE